MPEKIKHWNSFSVDEPSENSTYNQTEHPNAMPASERCPGYALSKQRIIPD
jgi:hypothetical protein